MDDTNAIKQAYKNGYNEGFLEGRKTAADDYNRGYKRGKRDAIVSGRWIKQIDGHFYCSRCGKAVVFDNKNFCPNCGADMRGEK